VFEYRFFGTGTIEEKVFQRQLSKEGLQGGLFEAELAVQRCAGLCLRVTEGCKDDPDRSCQRYTNCESVKQCVYGRLEGSLHIAHGHY